MSSSVPFLIIGFAYIGVIALLCYMGVMSASDRNKIISMLFMLQKTDSIIWALVGDQFKSLNCKRAVSLSHAPRRCFYLLLFFYLLGRDCLGVEKRAWFEVITGSQHHYLWLLNAGLIEKTVLKKHYRISETGVKFVNYCLADILDYSSRNNQIKKLGKPNQLWRKPR